MSVEFELPCECPICGHELTIDNIDYQPRGSKLVSMLQCPRCNYQKKLDTVDMDDIDGETEEEDDDFDPMALLKDPDEDDEDTKDDDEGVDLFPNGRDYDAEDEDFPFSSID